MGAPERAARMQGPPNTIVVSATTLPIPDDAAQLLMEALTAQFVDKFETKWIEGREFELRVRTSSASAVLPRTTQTGSNIKLESSATNILMGPGDSMRFRAAYDASGNQFWYQSSPLSNH